MRLDEEAPRELASGIDALYLSAFAGTPEWLVERLEDAKLEAEATDSVQPFRFCGEDFELQPYRWMHYPYCLTNGNGRLGVNPKGTIPPYRFQPRAEYLHGIGPSAVAQWFEDLLARHLGIVLPSVSRLDVFADFEGLRFEIADLDRFVGRARNRTYYEAVNRDGFGGD